MFVIYPVLQRVKGPGGKRDYRCAYQPLLSYHCTLFPDDHQYTHTGTILISIRWSTDWSYTVVLVEFKQIHNCNLNSVCAVHGDHWTIAKLTSMHNLWTKKKNNIERVQWFSKEKRMDDDIHVAKYWVVKRISCAFNTVVVNKWKLRLCIMLLAIPDIIHIKSHLIQEYQNCTRSSVISNSLH